MANLSQVARNALRQAIGNEGAYSEIKTNLESSGGSTSVDSAAITIGAEVADVINASVQLKDADGNNLAVVGVVDVILSDVATGIGVSTAGPTESMVIGTEGTIIQDITAGLHTKVQSNVSGVFDLDIGESLLTPTWYLVVILSTGTIAVSGAITFA